MSRIIDEILNRQWNSINPTFDNFNNLCQTVPRQPGLYSIITNATKQVLSQYGQRNDVKHYNLMLKIKASDCIPTELTINQNDNDMYCVYNGHHYNLRQRLIEHFFGSKGTGCLALFQLEELRKYNWTFEYLVLTNINNYTDSKVYRTLLEQHLRVKTGWPILCSQ